MGVHWGKDHLLQRALEALEWCSGSGDFQPRGKARKGWLQKCKPVLDAAQIAVQRGDIQPLPIRGKSNG